MEKDKYARKVGSYFLDREAGAKTEQEIREHLEDKIEYYMNRGISRENAEKRAVKDLGNPEILGRRLNQCHSPGIDRLTIWTIFFTGFVSCFLHLLFIENTVYFEKIPAPAERILGLAFLYVFGIVVSVLEIRMGMQETYSIRTQKGVITLWNSSYICGIGIGIAAQSWQEWCLLTLAGGFLTMAIRTVFFKKQWNFANRYFLRKGILRKDTYDKGQAIFYGDKRSKRVFYYNKKNKPLKKGSSVVVGAVEGYRLVIYPGSR